jgi:uncharacterized membrane protein
MSLRRDISELLEANIISSDVAQSIHDYYQSKSSDKEGRLFLIFGIIGAVLVSLGLILIMAHNWDRMSRWLKLVIAFTPLVIGQALCGYAYFRKSGNRGWSEACSTFLFLSIGGCISLISQIYHLPGDMRSFLFVWLLLAIPIIYLMQSSMVSFLCIAGIFNLSSHTANWEDGNATRYQYYILLVSIIPYYIYLSINNRDKYDATLHHWIIPILIFMTLMTSGLVETGFLVPVLFALFAIFYMIGQLDYFKENELRNNSYLVLGSLSSVSLLFICSFDEFWKYVDEEEYLLLFYLLRKKSARAYKPLFFAFILSIFLYFIRLDSTTQSYIINALLLVIGIHTIYVGVQRDHFGILNYGLLITALWIIVRFLDFDVSFFIRGIISVLLGVGFFVANYYLLKQRKNEA